MADRKPPSTLDILFVLPRITREDLGHAIPDQGFDLAGAVVAAGSYIVDDILKPGPTNAEPFGQETQFAKRSVGVDEVEVVVENSNATRQKVEGPALEAAWIGKVDCDWIADHGLAPAGGEARALHRRAPAPTA